MAKKKKIQKIPQVVVFTDTNNYPDSLASLVVLAYLHKQGLINLKGIVTEVGEFDTRRHRAMYAKGAMAALGLPFIRVTPGGDYEPVEDEDNHYPLTENAQIFERNGVAILRSAVHFIQEYFKSVKEKEIVVLLNAPFYDFGRYIQNTCDIVKKKVKKIVVLGNVLPRQDDQNYQPDFESYNFKIGQPAAQILFDYCQEKEVRLVVAPPQNIKDIEPDYNFLEAVKKSENPVIKELLNQRGENPLSMWYDMVSALALADKEFKAAGGTFVKDENFDKPVFFAKIEDSAAFKAKITEIYETVFAAPKTTMVQKITLDQLRRPKEENINESSE